MPDLEATGALPPDDTPRDLDAELEAEFADHLSLVARDEMLRGRAPDAAAEKAKERFGDLTKIERQCRWVHQGDAVMLRTVMIGGLVLLALALGASTWSSWQAQTNLRQQLAEVTARLEAMAQTQPPPTTGTISGVAYLGEKSKPAVGVEVQLLKAPPKQIGDGVGRTSDWVIERTLATDSTGRYRFEALVPGTYSVMAPLSEPDSAAWQWGGVQSRPASLAPGKSLDVPIDVKLRSGTLRIALSQALPGPFEVGGHELHLSVEGVISQWPWLPISDNLAQSIDDWPLRGYSGHLFPGFNQRFHFLPDRGFHVGNISSTFPPIEGRERGVTRDYDALKVLGDGEQPDPTKLVSIFSNPSFHVPEEDSRAPREDERWIAGEYSIMVMLLVIDSAGEAISIDELRDRYRFTDYPITVNWAPQEFVVAQGVVTDLRIVIPDKIEEWGKSIAAFQQSILTDSNYPSLRSSLMSRGSGGGDPQEFAKLINYPFEIEVTGPKPAE